MKKVVDCRGLSCPIPVLKTKEALESVSSGVVVVIVDNRASKENVKRFAEKAGCKVSVEEKEGCYYLKLVKGNVSETLEKDFQDKVEKSFGKSYVVLVTSTFVGEDKELGEVLTKGFIKTFLNANPLPSKVILVNTAVKLACKGADEEVLQALKKLQDKGVEIMCCATCLNHFNLFDKLEVGVPSNAYEVVQSLVDADSVVRL